MSFYQVNVAVTNLDANGQAVTQATFSYTEAGSNRPLGSSQLGGACVEIDYSVPQGQPPYQGIAYVFQPGSSAPGVAYLSATTAGTTTPAQNNSVQIIDPVGVKLGTVLNFSYTVNGQTLNFSSPDPQEKNDGTN